MENTLSKLIEDTANELETLGYTSEFISTYKSTWKKFQNYCILFNIDTVNEDNIKEFLEEYYKIDYSSKLSNHQVNLERRLLILLEFSREKSFKKCYQKRKYIVPDIFSDVFNDYIKYKSFNNISLRTIRGYEINIIKYLLFLKEMNIYDIRNTTHNEVVSYLNSLCNHSSQSKSGISFILRDFYNYLYKIGLVCFNGKDLFPVIFTNKRDRILSYYSKEEIKSVIDKIDTTTKIGKRDYIIILLATQLGIRAGDIRNLRRDNINWNNNTISFIQMKTNIPINLPLTDNVKYAMIDYLKNSRPKSDENYIFIRTRVPYEKYSQHSFYYIISKYIKLAYLDTTSRKKGLHSMRHSLASNLLNNNTPMPVITGILGHKSINTTQIYLSIDINNLRKLSLEVPIYDK